MLAMGMRVQGINGGRGQDGHHGRRKGRDNDGKEKEASLFVVVIMSSLLTFVFVVINIIVICRLHFLCR